VEALTVLFLWDYYGPQDIYRIKMAKVIKKSSVIQALHEKFDLSQWEPEVLANQSRELAVKANLWRRGLITTIV
jgi:hypothetical protein